MDILSYLMGQNSAIKKGMKVEVVTELPETGTPNVIYLVPKQDTGDNDIFEEYLYVDDDWELIGTTDIDLSGYQTTIQYSTMPTASADTVGKIVQYTGVTSSPYTNGYFYKGTSTIEDNETTYSWSVVDVQAHQNISGKEDTSNKVTSLSSSSTDTQYPSAKAVYDALGAAGGESVFATDSNSIILAGKKKGIYILKPNTMTPQAFYIGLNSAGSTPYPLIGGILYVLRDIPETLPGDLTNNEELIRFAQLGNGGYYGFAQGSYKTSNNSLTISQQDIATFLTLKFNQTITGTKTFNALPESSVTPTTDNQLTRKGYVDTAINNKQVNFAPAYNSTATYDEGDYVTYNGILYVCNTDISTAEAWTAAHWTQTNMSSILGNINTALDALTTVSGGA